ncbi:MAG: (Fe-S)-binding protein [bacterium]|nr:(Fe-S)-binding protein [bacterium]
MPKSTSAVTLFIPCLIDSMYPEVAHATVRLLRKLGIGLSYPAGQTCCGQPAFNAGYWKEARVAAEHFISVFADAETVICPSGSCVSMVRNHYPELFKDSPRLLKMAQGIGSRTFELTQFLVDVPGVEDVGARFTGTVTYHDSCHLLRGIGVRDQPRRLIQGVKGAHFVEMKDSDYCCGFGGAFSVKYPGISTAMLESKINNIIASGAHAVVGCDMGCLMNIEGMLSRMGSSVRTMHIAQLLDGSPHSQSGGA